MALSCETDFVAKNEQFTDLANRLAKWLWTLSRRTPKSLMQKTIDGMTVEARLVERSKLAERRSYRCLFVVYAERREAVQLHSRGGQDRRFAFVPRRWQRRRSGLFPHGRNAHRAEATRLELYRA